MLNYLESADLPELQQELKTLAASQQKLRRTICDLRCVCARAREGDAKAIALILQRDMCVAYEYCEQQLTFLALRYAEVELRLRYELGRLDS